MLCVKPTDDEKLKDEILSTLDIKGESPALLAATENDRLLGYVAVDPVGYDLYIPALSITDCSDYENLSQDEREIAEYLIRAAGNYGYNRMLLNICCENLNLKPLLSRFGFKEIDNKLSLDIKHLFKKCENCGSNH